MGRSSDAGLGRTGLPVWGGCMWPESCLGECSHLSPGGSATCRGLAVSVSTQPRQRPASEWTGRPVGQVRVRSRHGCGFRKRIPGSDPKDLDPGSVRIVYPTFTVIRQIHWDHRSAFTIKGEIHSDSKAKTTVLGSTEIRTMAVRILTTDCTDSYKPI